MKHMRRLICMALMIATVLSLSVSAFAAEYTFESTSDSEYYPSTSYEDIYGSYNYGGINVVDYQIPELSYGCFSTTQTGVMEKVRLPGLQQYVNVSTSAGGYGVGAGSYGTPVISSGTTITPVYREPAYTSAEDMERKDGSIGTLKIPSLDINMKVWEGETNASMAKGLGHYTTTSAWDGNVAVCGHNRGAKYVIGDIKDLEIGDTITYTTIYGTRTYEVVLVKTIASTDWSYLQATADNRITITTCLANQPSKRVCVQAVEVDRYGHDLDITQREMRYASIPDLRNEYHPGMEIDCIVKVFDLDNDKLEISIKETEVNPFFGAEQRHPVGSRRLAVISGKYGGGVFCNLPDGVVCMCNYSYQHEDADFMVGENVMLIVQRYEDEKLQMYGKIMSKW